MKKIDVEKWIRKEHFAFFSQFDEPFFGITAEVDCTIAYKNAKQRGYSFYSYYLHKSLTAANEIPEFGYRIYENSPVMCGPVNASPTIGREDGTFGFGFIAYQKDFGIFEELLKLETERVRALSGLCLDDNAKRVDVIHYSSIPWIKFTGLSHARNFKFADSVPKISFGKVSAKDGIMTMPVSINVHHGLVDGKHVGEYLEVFQALLNS